jgi:hypothetical protein
VGPGPHVRDRSAAFGGGEEAHYRRQWRALHAAVRLLYARRPTPEEYDSWARTPVPEAGPLPEYEEARRFAPCVAVHLHRTRGPTPKGHDSWAWAPMPEVGDVVCGEDEEAHYREPVARTLRGGLPSPHPETSALAV